MDKLEKYIADNISLIQEIRKESGIEICFTLDAGPNVHLLYFEDQIEQVNKIIVEHILKNNEQTLRIDDFFGKGPVKIG